MPWSVGDVDSHKKGLTAKQKKQWVAIANSVLKKLMSEGKSEEEAAASAIRQANGAVKTNMESLLHINTKEEGYAVKRRKFNGKDYMVIPVTMMVEGVHNGNHGSIFHSIDELGKVPESWNGIPIVINHPEKDGIAISANSPEVLEESSIGVVFGTHVDDMKLKAMAWIEELKLQEKQPELYDKIEKEESIEVSVGVFTDDVDEEGDWNDEHYSKVATNHRPDHLALLPSDKGACSLADGCGLGVNSEAEKKSLETFRKQGFVITRVGDYKEQGYNELMSMIYDKLRSMDTNKTYHYLEECYDDELIYSVSGDNNREMYKQSYKVEGGKIEFVGEAIKVRKKVEYVVNSKNNLKKEVKMSKENPCPKCVEKINALLANKESGFTEDDREWLNTLTEPQLDKAITPKVVEKTVEKTVEVNKLKPEDQAALDFGKKELATRREGWIKGILANTEKIWTEEKLKVKDDETLENIYKSVKKEEPVEHIFAAGGHIAVNSGQVAPLEPTGVEFEAKK